MSDSYEDLFGRFQDLLYGDEGAAALPPQEKLWVPRRRYLDGSFPVTISLYQEGGRSFCQATFAPGRPRLSGPTLGASITGWSVAPNLGRLVAPRPVSSDDPADFLGLVVAALERCVRSLP